MMKFLTLTAVLFFNHICFLYARSPVVIVPGTGGSQLQAKLVGKPRKPAFYCYSTTSSYFTLWLDIKSLLPFSINCWVDNIRLEWGMKTMVVKNSPGVLTRTPDFGGTSSVETLDSHGLVAYMKPLVSFLSGLGYKKGKDLRAAPYDFRYSPEKLPEGYHDSLKKLIEETYANNGNQQVSLISHSYGCPVTLYFLSLQSNEWKTKYLKQWIPLSGVFGGTIEQALLYSSGNLEGVPRAIVDPLKLRGEQRSSTSNLFMLPSAELWPTNDVMARNKKRSYRLSELDDFLNDIGFPDGVAMRKHLINSTYLMSTSPGVPIYCFHGNKPKSTISQIVFDDNFPDKASNILMGDGDGTVNKESLELCKKFASQQNEPVHDKEISGVNHNGVLSNEFVLQSIEQLLK